MSKSAISSLLSSIRLTPHLPPQSWYLIAGVALSTLNKPDEIPHVFHYAMEKDAGSTETPINIARRMREALVKASAIGGLPKRARESAREVFDSTAKILYSQSINALFALKKVTPPALLDEPLTYSPTERSVELYDMPASRILQRGQSFFDQIYGKVSTRVMGQMDRSGTEDLGITARLMYGYILSNTTVLSPAESSFVLIAGLIPQDVSKFLHPTKF
ncbi:MAG: hypothetical protein L6R40_001350 [Gallowayella cf. fulva]|nr:MAG: hypothetical protein L6R40_001350 [Xanthomendoza cf. fulva]